MKETKSNPITKRMVWEGYKRVKENGEGAGVDGISLEEYKLDETNNLYKLWNRLSSGSYFPPAVKEVEIPKGEGKTRKLGIPTVTDRIAQMVIKQYLEPQLEPVFHNSSFGYRPGRSAHQAVERTRKNCWKYDWVIDLDIKGFFDEIDHTLLNKALDKHNEEKWVRMYIDRWLNCPIQLESGEKKSREKGTPQGGVISPLLSNLFLHYGIDKWMEREYAELPFERYADDIIVHCRTEAEAVNVLERIRERLKACNLELHPEKTKIVYCRDGRRREPNDRPVMFSFLGFDFRSRKSKNSRSGEIFQSFNPAISKKNQLKIIAILRGMKISRWTGAKIEELAAILNPRVRGWINYYGKFWKDELRKVFRHLNQRLIKWIGNKYKKRGKGWYRSARLFQSMCKFQPKLFVHWQHGFMY